MTPSQCSLRCVAGPLSREIYAVCRPDPSESEAVGPQVEQVYHSLRQVLQEQCGTLKHVVREVVHFRNIREAMKPFLESRERVVGDVRGLPYFRPASTFVEQPPLGLGLQLEVAFHVVIPHLREAGIRNVPPRPPCRCGRCSPSSLRLTRSGGHLHLRAGNVHGCPGNAYQEAYGMYQAAEDLLKEAGMSFRHVVRTWIYLRRMQRDYSDFNLARRDFYRHAGVTLLPASTGIEGACLAPDHNFLLSLHAIRTPGAPEVSAMTTPTLNEAAAYGSDFSRGLRVADGNKVTLWISGTASVDERGRTAHSGDLPGQLDRMLVNITTLLGGQRASFADVVSLTTYLKDPAKAAYAREALHSRGLDDIPNALVQAAVCRDDLLCEMEAVAVLPLQRNRSRE